MQSPRYFPGRNHHYLAAIVVIALIILLIFEFVSFGIGAYFVYNQSLSNVVAETDHVSGNSYLNISAVGFTAYSSRMIWVDPLVTYDSSGNAFVIVNSGIRIANVTINADGSISGTYAMSNATLQKIENDGFSVHSVWVAGTGLSQLPGESGSLSLTSDSKQNYTTSTLGHGVTLFATLFTFAVPITFNLGQLFLVLWTVYVILFAAALNGPFRSLLGAIRASIARGIEGLTGNGLLATLVVFPVVLWGTVGLSLIEQASGISTGNLPTIDPLLEFVELAIAPLREEIGFRVIPIGVAALIVIAANGKLRDGILSLWHPARYLKKNDTPAQYRRHLYLMYVMIAVSSLLFGLAHVLLGAGWGPGKIASAALAGVALGGLYYMYGLPSAILLHWSIDYFLTVFTFNNQVLVSLGNFVSLYTLVLAPVGAVILVLLLIRKLRKRQIELSETNWGVKY